MGKFASIPTLYNGIQMRSRLEARWAAFFDLCKWDWEYEPLDLNGWIPDFRIRGVCDLLIEVKPYDIDFGFSQAMTPWEYGETEEDFEEDGEFSYPSQSEWSDAIKKVINAKPKDSILFLGNGFNNNDDKYFPPQTHYYLGYMISKKAEKWQSRLVTLLISEGDNMGYDLGTLYSYMSGELFGYPCRVKRTSPSKEKVMELWKEAGNIVQWKGKSK